MAAARSAVLLLAVAAALSLAAPAEARPVAAGRRHLAQLSFTKPDSCDELSENDFASAFASLDAACPQAEPYSCDGACFDGMHTVSAAAAVLAAARQRRRCLPLW